MRIAGNKIPGQWDNIKAMFVKTSTSVALPVYQASPLVTNDLTELEKDETKKLKRKRKRKKTPSLKDMEETSNDVISTQPVNEDQSPSGIIDGSDGESIVEEEKEEEEEEKEEEDVPKKKKKKKSPKKVSIPSKKKGPRTVKSK